MKLENKSVSQLKKHLWDLFSPIIRQKGMDEFGFVVCVTCGRVKHWKLGDAGHFIAGRRNHTLFDPKAVHFQCKPCNGSFMGSAPKDVPQRYKKFMVEKYGKKFVEDMIKKNRKTYQFEKVDLLILIQAAKKDYPTYERAYSDLQEAREKIKKNLT